MTDLESMFRSLQMELAAHRPRAGRDTDSDETSAGEKIGPVSIPVTVLTGFLGSGKSTLLAALLSSPPLGMAVNAVVNDVGELALDPTMTVDGSQLDVELSNGCGCCAGGDDLARALERAARSKPDLLVLEGSGLTDPFALAQIVEGDPALHLDRVVAVVDAAALPFLMGEPALAPILLRQLEAASSVVLAKTDLVEPDVAIAAADMIASCVPGRTITPSSTAELASRALIPGAPRGTALPSTSVNPDHDITTLTIDQRRVVPLDVIHAALEGRDARIVRCKGWLVTTDGPVVLQSSRSDWSVAPVGDSRGAYEREPSGQMLIVGTDAAVLFDFAASLGCSTDVSDRPELDVLMDEHEFARWYWTMAELQPFARTLGVRASGRKAEIAARIAAKLGGRPQPPAAKRTPAGPQLTGPVDRTTVIPEGQRSSDELRSFFEAEIGPAFTFNGHMRAFLLQGQATLGDAIHHWHTTVGTPLPKQSESLEFNRFTRAWHEANPDGTATECREAWAIHRALPVDERPSDR